MSWNSENWSHAVSSCLLASWVFDETHNAMSLLQRPMYEFRVGSHEEQTEILKILESLTCWKEYTTVWYVAVFTYARFISELLYLHRGSILENHGLGHGAMMQLRLQLIQMQERAAMIPITKYMKDTFEYLAEDALDLHKCLMSRAYHRKKTKQFVEVIREELMQKTWHPSRVQWWMDEEEKRDLGL